MSNDSEQQNRRRDAAERRTSPRYRLSSPPAVELFDAESGTQYAARLSDLSRGGCYLETDCALPLETDVTLTLKKDGDEVGAHARIVRAFPNKGLGLAFTSMDGDGFRILDAWLSAFVTSTWVAASRRRSQRAAMQIEVRVSGYNTEGTRFTEDTQTVEISAFGGSVTLQTRVHRGQRLVLSYPKSNAAVECMVAHYSAKGALWEVGLAFLIPNQPFWPIVFPPADWSSSDSDTKRSGS
jgi:hypothetical protein